MTGLVIGVPAAILAARVSVRLFPPGGARVRWGAALPLCGHFLRDSIVAGVDVAWRAFHPRLPLRTGFVTCECGIPEGPRRDLFLGMGSLMPGSLPVEEHGDGRIVFHCLDTEQPLAAQMAVHEKRLTKALGDGANA